MARSQKKWSAVEIETILRGFVRDHLDIYAVSGMTEENRSRTAAVMEHLAHRLSQVFELDESRFLTECGLTKAEYGWEIMYQEWGDDEDNDDDE
jgi:hypothetical protein